MKKFVFIFILGMLALNVFSQAPDYLELPLSGDVEYTPPVSFVYKSSTDNDTAITVPGGGHETGYSVITSRVLNLTGGRVGIGTSNTFDYRLAVNGVIGAKKVMVETTSAWPDYVFSGDYNLRPLPELEQFIRENNHLPEIPSAAEVAENGIDIGDMQAKLLLKIEELTLYILQQNDDIQSLKAEVNSLKEGGRR